MPFSTSYSGELKETLAKMFKKDKGRYEILMKKIEQISLCGEYEIEHYKNLMHGQSDRKRVHVDKSFALTFRVDRQRKHIFFLDFEHHDKVY